MSPSTNDSISQVCQTPVVNSKDAWLDVGAGLPCRTHGRRIDTHRSRLCACCCATGGEVAHYTGKNSYFKIYSLKRMQAVGWSSAVQALLKHEWEHGGEERQLCELAEANVFRLMERRHPELFASLEDTVEWEGFIPRVPMIKGVGVIPFAKSSSAEYLWQHSVYKGLVDPTRMFVYCPGFAETLLHLLAIATPFPFSIVELLQVVQGANRTFHHLRQDDEGFQEHQVYGTQRYRCGRPVKLVHLVRNFHFTVPWSLRLLDTWSRVQGTWPLTYG